MSKSNFRLLVITLSIIFFSGCSAKLAPETKIPKPAKVDNINHVLTKENKKLLTQEYYMYQDNTVIGLGTHIMNQIEKSNYEAKDINMQNESMFDCTISRMTGQYIEPYFYRAFAMHSFQDAKMGAKSKVILMNYNDVNEYIVYPKTSIYQHKDGGFGMGVIAKDFDLSAVVSINYKCKAVENKLFK